MNLEREEIKRILPHRDPMLLLHRMEIGEDDSVTAECRLSGDEWFFFGHFPNEPVLPGAVICEIMAQACCGLFHDSLHGKIPYLVQIEKAAFRRPVIPPAILKLHCRLMRKSLPFAQATCEAFENTKLCAQAQLSFMVKDRVAAQTGRSTAL